MGVTLYFYVIITWAPILMFSTVTEMRAQCIAFPWPAGKKRLGQTVTLSALKWLPKNVGTPVDYAVMSREGDAHSLQFPRF